MLERAAGMGYVSAWAERYLENLSARYAFYREIGERLAPGRKKSIEGTSERNTPAEILARV
ncbi:MAG: hypothetical protein AAB353_05720, partial [Candidatus Hydrogenedentota bacterium]